MTDAGYALVYVVGAGQGLLLAVALWRRQGPPSHRLLAAWIGAVSLDLAVRGAWLHDPDAALLPWYGLSRFLPFLYGSAFYVYVRTLVDARPLRRADAVHLAGFALALLLNMDLFFWSPAQLEALFGGLRAGAAPLRFVLFDLALFGWSLTYVTAALWQVHRYRQRVAQTRSDPDRTGLRWLQVTALCQAGIWLIATLHWLADIPGVDYRLIYAAVAAWVFAVGYLGLRQPALEYVPPLPPQPACARLDERLPEVAAKLDRLLEKEQLWREPALTIGKLARRAGYPEYLVSEAINRTRGVTFSELINRCRIEGARQALGEPADGRTILDIAYDCGFTSKSTFNASFKRLVGTTPSRFRSDHGAPARS